MMIEPRRNKFYDLDGEQQDYILDTMKRYFDNISNPNVYIAYHRLLDFLNNLNIIIAYDWPGHREEMFAPTESEMEDYIDWCYQCGD